MANISRLPIKFLELLIAVICVGLHYKSRTGDWTIETLSSVAFGAFIIILIGGFAGYLFNAPIHKNIDIFYSLVGFVLFAAAGSLTVKHYVNQHKSEWWYYGIAKGSLAVINGAAFLLDLVITWCSDRYTVL